MTELLTALRTRPASPSDLDTLRAEIARLDSEEDALAGQLDTLRRQLCYLRQLVAANAEPLPEIGVVCEKVEAVVVVKRKRGHTKGMEARQEMILKKLRAALSDGQRLTVERLAFQTGHAYKTVADYMTRHADVFQRHPSPNYTLYSLRETEPGRMSA